MQFTTLLVAALASIAAATPAPQNQNEEGTASVQGFRRPEREHREHKVISLWTEEDFLGFKFTGEAKVGECKNLRHFNNRASSGKSEPGFRCTIWAKNDCKGTAFSFIEEDEFPHWIDDKASSYKCVRVERD